MFNIINFLVILIIWGILFLIIKQKETFILHPFIPWGDTLQGCIDRCQISTHQNLDEDECTVICNKCTNENCKWKINVTEAVVTEDTDINNFEIQVIPGKDNALVRWKYNKPNNKQQPLTTIDHSKPEFSEKESFVLKSETGDVIFKYNNEENYFFSEDESSEYIIAKLYEVIKLGYTIDNQTEHEWYIITSETAQPICVDAIHPLNSEWTNTQTFTKYNKKNKTLKKFIIQLVDSDNVETGIMIYEEDYTISSKLITNLRPNTNFNLSIYPLFIEETADKELSDIISFSTDDNKFMDSTSCGT
jgi:hypothetical protein